MKRIAFIIPYFGKFNNYFQLFLKTCEKNADICDWIIFTDDYTRYRYPHNVIVHYLSWEEMRKYFQSKFDFAIELNKPYKLCDFKVAYGYVFEKYLTEYEFWGHCDVDLLWGKFSHFVTKEILDDYAKIFNLGHCTIFKNTPENNRVFFKTLYGSKRYLEVFMKSGNCSFDEEYKDSINCIYDEYKIPIYEKSFAANIYTKSSYFKLTRLKDSHDGYVVEERKKNFFVWSNGILKRYVWKNNEMIREEYLYIHLQSRKMDVKINADTIDEFKIIPNAFEELEMPVNIISNINFKSIKTKRYNLHYFKLRTKNLMIKIKRLLKKV